MYDIDLKVLRALNKLFDYIYVGVKSLDHITGLGPIVNLTTSEEKVWAPKRVSAQFLWAQTCLKDDPRRNVSSNVLSMAQAHSLPALKNHSNVH